LQITVRPAGGGAYTTLAPRQPFTSAPYSIRSLNSTTADTATNALNLGGIPAATYVVTTDPRMSDARNPLPGSANYIWNQNSVLQPSSNFVISGNGFIGGTLEANAVNISGDGTVGGTLSAGGTLSGSAVNATGVSGFRLNGNRILTAFGGNNLTVGIGAGFVNFGQGINNTFVGSLTGNANTLGDNNTFVGSRAGSSNIAGNFNSFFGNQAGETNTGQANSFFGNGAGVNNMFGSSNAFFGTGSGNTNTSGSNNTVIGSGADVGANSLSFATAIGAGAVVGLSNTVLLGRIGGSDLVQIPGQLQLVTLAGGGATNLCRTATAFIATCSSSLRYKTNINPFGLGLNLIKQLKPITFDWKDGGTNDLGLGAEDVAAIEPLLVTYNRAGQVEGVKYDRIGVVAVNAIKEQQAEIEAQRSAISRQQSVIELQQKQIDALKKLVCAQNATAEICQL
jgi:hypothetical protein